MNTSFSNQRGTAKRHENKIVRVGTHKHVLEFCLQSHHVTSIIEHGMGVVSTSFFHNIPTVNKIFSLENDRKWQRCDSCNEHTKHYISEFITKDELKKSLIDAEIDFSSCLSLIDGPHLERCSIIDVMLEFEIPSIVEHDVEVLTEIELLKRTQLCKQNSYNMYQYIKQNPETMLYSKIKINDPCYVTIFEW